ncbi:ATP-binding protein [Blautia hansenii]|nr:ATP-binding protein [Blautia hansenii]ASM69106.1 ATP-binding protein [Blautia hansenii DSM 20583]UWO11695.1 ATP-binding protein [Blautia hansenii DSM 20583]
MSTPGIGDPYWYEWYVGLENIIEMLNEDSGIKYVIFQAELYDTIDDVVVGYENHEEYCYQVKHEVGLEQKYNLTFGKLLENKVTRRKDGEYMKPNLLQALAEGWKKANESGTNMLIPVLYTNRKLGINKTNREYKGQTYSALPLGEFITDIQNRIECIAELKAIEFKTEETDIRLQYLEFYDAFEMEDSEILDFLKAIKIKSEMHTLAEMEKSMLSKMQEYFHCSDELAGVLFRNLTSQLRIWTTTRRSKEKITIEDVYNALALKQEYTNDLQHQLVAPSPFFESRKEFVNRIIEEIYKTDKKVVFLSGEPGCGKTSVISYLQNNYNCFAARYHTFKPISPEQRFYNSDEGLCLQETLWGELLNQLRRRLKGQIAKYKIPVSNALCTIEELRREVLRILEILYKSEGKKACLCIDGLDHAARSKATVTFMSSLFQPDEIPEGVCFIIVGQPEEMYENYPIWLTKNNPDVLYMNMPRLVFEDVKQFLYVKGISAELQNDGLARAIYEKTQGNNLSVVFAIEELKRIVNIEDALNLLDSGHVSGDVEQYYAHIWNHLKGKIQELGLQVNFPDIVVASVILLLNGRIKTDILADAFKDIDLSKNDWDYVFDSLYPVIKRSEKDNSYYVFHNDFRVFLMGIIKRNKAKFKDMSYKMAMYFVNDSDEVLDRYVNIVPLLCCAEREDIIPQIFTAEFVIGALATGISRKLLERYAQQAYQNVCRNKNWDEFHDVYLAICTIKQHYSYFEYYDMNYEVNDVSAMQQIYPFEIVSKKLSLGTLGEFLDVLTFINRLIKDGGDKHSSRISTVYDLWFSNLLPEQAITILLKDEEISENVWDTNGIFNFMKVWGKTAAFLEKYECLIKNVQEGEGEQELLAFNDAFFDYYFYAKKYSQAIEIVQTASITYDCIESKIFQMMEEGSVKDYKEVIQVLAKSNRNNSLNKLAHVLYVLNEKDNDDLTNILLDYNIKYLSDDETFRIVVESILEAARDWKNDINIICGHLLRRIQVEKKDYNERENEYLKMLLRVCAVIGRHIINDFNLEESEKRIIQTFFQTYIFRTFDFSKAYRTIAYCLCNMKCISISLGEKVYADMIKEALFNYSNLGQYCKTIYLRYLKKTGYFEIIKEYFSELYGQDGSRLVTHDQYKDMFFHFYDFAVDVFPELCRDIRDKMKWNVVGYTGHKEYALDGPKTVLEKLLKEKPQLWETEGVKLYALSNVADIASGNRVAGEIENIISRAAIKSGVADYWKWHHYDSDITYSLHTLYTQIFDIISTVKSAGELLDVWLYSCGIQSWYRQDDRIGIESIYFKCIKKAKEIGYDSFEEDCYRYTPSYVDICLHRGVVANYTTKESEFDRRWKKEIEESIEMIDLLPASELLECILYQKNDSHVWKKINRALARLDEEGLLTVETADTILESVINKMFQYTWEHYGCTEVLERLLAILGENASWRLAESIVLYLNEDHYYASTSNMFFILKRNYDKFDLQDMFCKEVASEYAWVSGNGHIKLQCENNAINEFNMIPDNLQEALFTILLENLSFGNIHRMEIALPAIYNMCQKSKELFLTILKTWDSLSEHAKESLMLCGVRWAREQTEGFEIIVPMLEKIYENSNVLSIKYILHTVLNLHYKSIGKEGINLSFATESANDTGYQNILSYLHKGEVDSSTKFFLQLLNNFEDVEDLYRKMPLYKEDSECKFPGYNRDGDSICFAVNKRNISHQILYGEERGRRWDYIPVHIKKQWLLQMDDAYLMTSIPQISYNACWDVEASLKKYNNEHNNKEIEKICGHICMHEIHSDEVVIGAVLWYPFNQRDGLIYTMVSKVLTKTEMFIDKHILPAFINYSMLYDEEFYFELYDESISKGGISLLRECVGTALWYYNNPMLCPTNILRNELELISDPKNPFKWYDNKGDVALRYERIVNPTRELIQQYYIRQPILSRWICKKEILNDWLEGNKLHLKYATELKQM